MGLLDPRTMQDPLQGATGREPDGPAPSAVRTTPMRPAEPDPLSLPTPAELRRLRRDGEIPPGDVVKDVASKLRAKATSADDDASTARITVPVTELTKPQARGLVRKLESAGYSVDLSHATSKGKTPNKWVLVISWGD